MNCGIVQAQLRSDEKECAVELERDEEEKGVVTRTEKRGDSERFIEWRYKLGRKVWVETWIRSLEDIDLARQRFHAHIVVNLLWEQDEENKDDDHLKRPFQVKFREIIGVSFEYKETQTIEWDGKKMVVQTVDIRGAFGELFELENYPFDIQDLTIYIECEQPVSVAYLEPSRRLGDVVVSNFKTFTDQEYKFRMFEIRYVIQKSYLPSSDPYNSTMIINFQVSRFLTRKILLTFGLIGLISFATLNVFGLDIDQYPNDRVSIILGILVGLIFSYGALTKQVPETGYITVVELYLLMNLIFVVLMSCQSAFWIRIFNAANPGKRLVEPAAVPYLCLTMYILMNVCFGLYCFYLYSIEMGKLGTLRIDDLLQRRQDHSMYMIRGRHYDMHTRNCAVGPDGVEVEQVPGLGFARELNTGLDLTPIEFESEAQLSEWLRRQDIDTMQWKKSEKNLFDELMKGESRIVHINGAPRRKIHVVICYVHPFGEEDVREWCLAEVSRTHIATQAKQQRLQGVSIKVKPGTLHETNEVVDFRHVAVEGLMRELNEATDVMGKVITFERRDIEILDELPPQSSGKNKSSSYKGLDCEYVLHKFHVQIRGLAHDDDAPFVSSYESGGYNDAVWEWRKFEEVQRRE